MQNIRLYTLSFLLCLIAVSTQAQNRRGRPNVDELHEKKWEFLTKEVNLSPAEENTVKPVFLDYEKNIWELHKKTWELFRKSREADLTEKEYSELNDKMVNMEIKRSHYLREYHMKLRKLLKSETLFKYYLAEKKFERELLHQRPQGPRGPQGPKTNR